MAASDPDKDLIKIQAWLDKQGYPVEYETARCLRAEGFQADQGMCYETEDEGVTKLREIDIVARLERTWPGVSVALVAECKHVTAPAWVILTSTSPTVASIRWTSLVATPDAKQVIGRAVESIGRNYKHPLTELLAVPDRYGVGVKQAAAGKDAPYEAINQAISAAFHLVRQHGADSAVSWPIVVADGPLYQLGFNQDGTQLLERVQWKRVLWRGLSLEPVSLDIVGRADLADYAKVVHSGLYEVQGTLHNAPAG
jgi:hypothetical protein